MHADLAKNLETLADDIGKIVENLGQVTAGFALQHDGGDEELDVDERNAVGEIDERVANGKPEFLLFVELAEFAGDGLGYLVGDHFERGREGVAGADGAREGIDGLGKFLIKLGEALGAHLGSPGVRKEEAEQEAHPAEDPVAPEEEGDEGDSDGRDRAQHEEVAGANIDMALGKNFLQLGNAAGTAEKIVESGNLAEGFVAQKGGFGLGLLVLLVDVGEAIAQRASACGALVE